MKKETLRNAVRQRRLAIPREEKIKAEKEMFENFVKLVEWQGASVIASYNPLPEEADVSQISHFLLGEKKLVCFPEVLAKGENMQYHKWQAGSVMKPDWCGIDYPIGQIIPTEKIDLFVVPLFGFDRFCNRLGTGGGFYDKFFAKNIFKENALKVGIAFGVQEVPMMMADKWDVKMDIIVTENELVRG